jgi:hypothetical protein
MRGPLSHFRKHLFTRSSLLGRRIGRRSGTSAKRDRQGREAKECEILQHHNSSPPRMMAIVTLRGFLAAGVVGATLKGGQCANLLCSPTGNARLLHRLE